MLDTQPEIDFTLRERVREFHALETRLLNQRQFDAWLNLLADDFTYVVPTPVTPDNAAANPWSAESSVIDETKESLEILWAVRHLPQNVNFAWGENPPQRIRRFVTGVHVAPTARSHEYATTSDILLSFVRQSDPAVLVPAGRSDIVRDEDGVLKLASRRVYLDQTMMTVTHMRLVF